jgi:hypothetical protein
MSTTPGPYFANVVQMHGMEGGNASLANGYYIPSSARQFSFPVYTKYCQRSNTLTTTKLCLLYQNRCYIWVIRDGDERVIARVKYPPSSPPALSLPEHVPASQRWELLSTGFFSKFKKKPAARVTACDDNVLLQQMSSFIGSNGYMDSVSESIRFIDSTVQDMEDMLAPSQSHALAQAELQMDGASHTPTDDENYLAGINLGMDIEDMTLDEMIQVYSNEIFNGYGALVPQQDGRGGGSAVPFAALQEQVEARVTSSLHAALDMDKVGRTAPES